MQCRNGKQRSSSSQKAMQTPWAAWCSTTKVGVALSIPPRCLSQSLNYFPSLPCGDSGITRQETQTKPVCHACVYKLVEYMQILELGELATAKIERLLEDHLVPGIPRCVGQATEH
ncbi:uncharacterized protein UV8b_07099 [Ustilaginoidea virens]|uniref:Uncharacterized protein n=1 Tax=Ustilaginoidea virens TaxID=1159556 RepID=A0A8E5HWJ4_USTVR|nr:uncharacterized protein UV8b_07099 [Ustilaginoidea virens]QUC22858.1 hypothetical protein UV8b_07099 [Ustilaginoidea virens]